MTANPIDHRSAPTQTFRLQRMEDIYEHAQGQTDQPHRHDYYTVLLVMDAAGEHLIDDHRYPFEGEQVFFVSPGQVHQVALRQKPKGWVLTFTADFLLGNNIPESFISNINLFRDFGETPPLQLDETTKSRLCRTVREMESCLPPELSYRERALGALLQLFLIYCNNSCSLHANQLDESNPGVCRWRSFKKLVDQQYAHWHKVQDYANELYVTPKHLSQTVKNITGKTAKTIIQDRILLEAKRLLIHTELSVKEIALRLGFEAPLHFSAFFKKQAGQSASEFRA
ncbi:MAG TPA: AraC family transcriptional regulator [Phaeodactylibacter sp.]|nr:AraC family transcriptional regulator [Phaeodactylibacter sp.]